jgi:hypothetical protein
MMIGLSVSLPSSLIYLPYAIAGAKGLVGLGMARVSNPSIFPNNLGSTFELIYRTHRKILVYFQETHTL